MTRRDLAARRIPILWVLWVLCVLTGCLGGGNSGSETTNGLVGTVRDRDDRPVAGARVVLLREDHNGARPEGDVSPPETRTDRSGAYLFREVKPGTYNIEISDSASGTRAWLPGIHVQSDADRTSADGVLETPGTVEIPVPDWLDGARPGYLYLPGTTEYKRVDSAMRAAGEVVLGPLAPGTYPSLMLVVEENAEAPLQLAAEIRVEAGSRAVVAPFESWAHSRRIDVDPRAAGNGASGSFGGFPLLVRLVAGSGGPGNIGRVEGFDFSQAARDGGDIRFTGADGKALAHEIESWDSIGGRAEIWVRMETLGWDAADQRVTLHWGRPGAKPVSSGPAVFSGPAAFASVWHLAEPGNEEPGGYRDATAQANHATASGTNKTPHLEGVAGMGKAFAGDLGTLSAKVPKGLGGNAGFTVTFWMKAVMQPGGRASIMHFGRPANLAGFHFLIRPDTTSQFGAHEIDTAKTALDVAAWQNVFGLTPFLGRWTLVALTYDPAARRTTTWMDGVKIAESPMAPEGLALDAQGGLRIGRALSGSVSAELPFDGILDEIRFHSAILPESRIRLDYETQKP